VTASATETAGGKAHFLLIVGAMHGAWVWRRIVPLLEAAGYAATALELPGMGEDRSVAPGDVTLAGWADFVADAVRASPAPVILVGHSRGGVVIGEAAERVPDRLAGLVYVTALIVPPGRTAFQTMQVDPAAYVTGISVRDGAMTATPEMVVAGMYHRCTPAEAAEAASRLCPEPYASFSTPAGVSWERWGRVPRAFIECEDDRSLPLALQRSMQIEAPCDPVIRIDADHSPFFSASGALADALIITAQAFTHPSAAT